MPSKDPKVRYETNKKYKHNNRDRINAAEKIRKAQPHNKLKRLLKQRTLRQKVFDILGNCCTCCGESIFEFLAIDHINGGGRQERLSVRRGSEGWSMYILSQENIKEKYQILCHNCNMAKGFYGTCPHKYIAGDPLSAIDPT